MKSVCIESNGTQDIKNNHPRHTNLYRIDPEVHSPENFNSIVRDIHGESSNTLVVEGEPIQILVPGLDPHLVSGDHERCIGQQCISFDENVGQYGNDRGNDEGCSAIHDRHVGKKYIEKPTISAIECMSLPGVETDRRSGRSTRHSFPCHFDRFVPVLLAINRYLVIRRETLSDGSDPFPASS